MLARLVLIGILIGLYFVSSVLAWAALAAVVVFVATRGRRHDAVHSILQS